MSKSRTTPQAASKKPAKALLRMIRFTTRIDGAREVLLTGDFTNWTTSALRLSRAPDGMWTAPLQLAPGEYQYRLLVDGQWRDHPEAQRRVANPFGTENGVLTVA